MKLSVTSGVIANKSEFAPGARGYFATEDNPLTVIGEDDTHVWVLLDRGPTYYGVFKDVANLAAIHVPATP